MTLLYKVSISKRGEDSVLKEIHVSANSIHQALGMAGHLVYEHMTEFDNTPIEISGIERVKGIIIANSMCSELNNMDEDDDDDLEEFSGDMPLKAAENMPEEATLTFECPCHEKLTVPRSFFPYVTCPNCELQIKRIEIKTTGGISYYEKFEPKKKK